MYKKKINRSDFSYSIEAANTYIGSWLKDAKKRLDNEELKIRKADMEVNEQNNDVHI